MYDALKTFVINNFPPYMQPSMYETMYDANPLILKELKISYKPMYELMYEPV